MNPAEAAYQEYSAVPEDFPTFEAGWNAALRAAEQAIEVEAKGMGTPAINGLRTAIGAVRGLRGEE